MGQFMEGADGCGCHRAEALAVNKQVTHGLLLHGMERFNRGMQGQLNSDVFVADVVKARCAEPTSMY